MEGLSAVPAALAKVDPSSPWWIIVAALAPGIGTGAYVLLQLWNSRKDKKTDVQMTREEKLIQEMNERITSAARIDADVIARGVSEITRLQAREVQWEGVRDRLEKDRDRGWNLARWWNRRAHNMRHAAANARQAAELLAEASNKPAPVWANSLELPDFEDADK